MLLKGKVIVSTRRKNDVLREKAEAQAAVLKEFPVTEIKPAKLEKKDIQLLENIQTFDLIIFTAKNGVVYFFELLKYLGVKAEKLPETAVIGKSTEKKLNEYGYPADYLNPGTISDDFIQYLKQNKKLKGKKALFAAGNLAPDNLRRGLAGFLEIKRVNVYKTVLPKTVNPATKKMISEARYDWIYFASPSAYDNFLQIMQPEAVECKRIACIGKKTAGHIEAKGRKPDAIAARPDAEHLIRAIIDFEQKKHHESE